MNKLAKILPIAALAIAAPLAITGAAKAQAVYVTPAAPAPYACSYYDPYYCPGYADYGYDYGGPGYVGFGWNGGWGGHGGGWARGAHVSHGFAGHAGHGGFVHHH
jgi:hypothetical protein